LREQRPGDAVGFDVDHHDMLAVLDRRETEFNAGRGVAGGFDDDVDLGAREERHGVVGDAGGAGLERLAEGFCLGLLGGPADFDHAAAGAIGEEVSETDEMHARRQARLREVQGAELAGAELADAHGAPLGGTLLEHV
jgi:hypothetical protein